MIIGISGKARSGKDTLANVLCTHATRRGYRPVRLAFADDIKQEVAEFLDVAGVVWEPRHLDGTHADKEDQLVLSNASEVLTHVDEFSDFLLHRARYVPTQDVALFTPRQLMQWWGTDYRRKQNDWYWVQRTLARCSDPGQLYVITDVRHTIEVRALLGRGPLIRVVRPDAPRGSGAAHPSETELDGVGDYTWSHILVNDGTLEQFLDQALKLCHEVLP